MEKKEIWKLLELINEYEDWWDYDDYWGIYQYWMDSDAYIYHKYYALSKSYWFVKRLVEQDKIDRSKLNYTELYKAYELACIPLDKADELLMLLSIQENPIEFLINILK